MVVDGWLSEHPGGVPGRALCSCCCRARPVRARIVASPLECEGSLLAFVWPRREKGSEAVSPGGHGMAVPAAGRCLCGGRPAGRVPAPGVPVVRGAAGVLVGVPALRPRGRALRADLHPAAAVRAVPGDPRAAAGVCAGLAAGYGRGDRRGDRRGGQRAVRDPPRSRAAITGMREAEEMDHKLQDQIALHRWAVIAEAANGKLTARERGALARQIAARSHAHPDGSQRAYSRGTIDRWLRAWRAGGLDALRPSPRADTGVVRAHPELFAEASALRLELPGRSAAQIASILFHRHGTKVSERTARGQLRRAGLAREALAAEPRAYGRYEAAAPNERWITDVLVGPWVPFPKRDGSVRGRLVLIVDDHSRLLVDCRVYAQENARGWQELLRRAITPRRVPQVLYCDNGAPFSNAWLARTCGVLGIRLVHSKPYSPEGRGKQERLNRYIREAFLAEAMHAGVESPGQLNDLFAAWAEHVANRRAHAE